MSFKFLFKGNRLFVVLLLLGFLLGSYPLLVYEKVTLFLLLNTWHHPYLNSFFYYITWLGSSPVYCLLLVLLAVTQQKNHHLLAGIGSFISMSALIQLLKHIPYFEQLRPIALIPVDFPVHLVEGVVHQTHNSFPSGHAGTIFTAIALIHFLLPKKPAWLSLTMLLLAITVAYSRIYLGQHFYRDIYVGAMIGSCSTTLVYALLQYWRRLPWLRQTPWQCCQEVYSALLNTGPK